MESAFSSGRDFNRYFAGKVGIAHIGNLQRAACAGDRRTYSPTAGQKIYSAVVTKLLSRRQAQKAACDWLSVTIRLTGTNKDAYKVSFPIFQRTAPKIIAS